MKICAITQKLAKTNIVSAANTANRPVVRQKETVSSPMDCFVPSFKGIEINKMYEQYDWFIRNDNTPAIKSFLKMTFPQEEMDKFLSHILSTEDRSYEFIDSIVHLPRETANIMRGLTEKVGSSSKNLMTFCFDSPYNNAYTKYIEKKYDSAKNLTELLKIRPDWSEEALIKKYRMLAGNDKLKIGNLPKQVPLEHWDKIIPYLRENMEIGFKSEKKINDLIIDGRKYEFKYFTEGKSSKNVFGVFVPMMMKKYVVKIDDPAKRSLDAPFSLGTLAKIDKYLTANSSRNSAPLCYYDHEGNYSVYKYIEHSNVTENTKDINIIKSHLPDFRALGLDYNDTVGYKNFFVLNEKSIDTHWRMEGFNNALNKNEWISVDNDHVTFNNSFQPSISGYHKSLPNAMGMFF